ncbi:MAG: hypothetical protein IPJ21_03255 [Sterolibacteriaceae bacterium]|nr:hypothetical protein [Sterolibacteriaceae bacterium]MBK9086673.1 hypothetical protein [Sterolibacteriaceae bacterium]
MDKTPHGWNVFDAQTPILTYAYSFGPGIANALAVGCEGGLMVLSPPRKAEGAFEDLERFGAVRALVATNAFHHMGLAKWKARCPAAELFAPAQSIARVERQTGLRDIQPIDNARAITGPRLDLVDMPFYKTGEVLLRVDSAHGLVWYVTDVIMNMRELPRHPLARLAFRLSGSAPGLRYNNIAPLFMVRDKAALRRWLADEARNKPPRWLIPAHGDIVDLAADPDAARRLFATT